jgi:hypothetical protein
MYYYGYYYSDYNPRYAKSKGDKEIPHPCRQCGRDRNCWDACIDAINSNKPFDVEIWYARTGGRRICASFWDWLFSSDCVLLR